MGFPTLCSNRRATRQPVRGSDQGAQLENPNRPQSFALDNNPVYSALLEQNAGVPYEYDILHPILYYLWGYKAFFDTESKQVVLGSDHSVSYRALHYGVLQRTFDCFEWLCTRHALLTARAKLGRGEITPEFLGLLQDEVYSRVGQE